MKTILIIAGVIVYIIFIVVQLKNAQPVDEDAYLEDKYLKKDDEQ